MRSKCPQHLVLNLWTEHTRVGLLHQSRTKALDKLAITKPTSKFVFFIPEINPKVTSGFSLHHVETTLRNSPNETSDFTKYHIILLAIKPKQWLLTHAQESFFTHQHGSFNSAAESNNTLRQDAVQVKNIFAWIQYQHNLIHFIVYDGLAKIKMALLPHKFMKNLSLGFSSVHHKNILHRHFGIHVIWHLHSLFAWIKNCTVFIEAAILVALNGSKLRMLGYFHKTVIFLLSAGKVGGLPYGNYLKQIGNGSLPIHIHT